MQRPVSNTYGREKTLSLQKLQVPSTFSQFFWVKLKFVYDPLWIKAGPTILLDKPPGWNTCKLVSNWVSPFWLLRQGTRGTPQKSLDKMYIFLFKNWAQGLTIVLSQKLSSYLHSCKKAIACCILLQNNGHITKSFTSLLHCTYFEYATFTSPIMHLICAPPPPKKKKKCCTTFVFHFPWVLQPSQEKPKTMLMQHFGGQTRCIMGDVQVACHYGKWTVLHSQARSSKAFF